MHAHSPQRPTTRRLLAFWALLLLVSLRALMPSAFMPMAETGRGGTATLAMCVSGNAREALPDITAPAEFKALVDAAQKAPPAPHHDGSFCDFCACPSAATLAHTLAFDAQAPPVHASPRLPSTDAPRRLAIHRAAARAPPYVA